MNIAIIGGGFCGTTLASRLLKDKSQTDLEITLIEKGHNIGKGIAYSTNKTFHLLNVKAENMSAFPENPNHFCHWLKQKNIPVSETGFMPRKVYGMYINDILEESMLSISDKRAFKIVREEAIDIDLVDDKGYVVCESGRIIEADRIILALGNYPPSPLKFDISEKFYCNNPWECHAIEKLTKDKTILLIGTGLTMVDLCATLENKNHKGKIIALSTHGYMPAVHMDYEAFESTISKEEWSNGLMLLYSTIKFKLNALNKEGKNWRGLIDPLRPFIQKIWHSFTPKDKQSFMKNLSRIWNISRHRIPPEYGAILNKLKKANILQLKKGKIINLQKVDNSIEVSYKPRGGAKEEKFKVDFIINCTGPQVNYSKITQPLIKNLLKKNLVETGELNMGLNATEEGALISKGKASTILFTLGPPLIGKLYETTAVPELREQVKNLAAFLLRRFIPNQLLVE